MEKLEAISARTRRAVDRYLRTLGSNDERIVALQRLHAEFRESMSGKPEAEAILAALQDMIDRLPRH